METRADQIIPTLTAYFAGKKGISAVYLFGSYATGQPRRTSDVDIGILFENPDPKENSESSIKHNLALARMLRKDIHLITLNNADERLLNQIFSKGHCIQINNLKHHAIFKMTSFSKIAEFGYYKSQFEKSFTRKLMQR